VLELEANVDELDDNNTRLESQLAALNLRCSTTAEEHAAVLAAAQQDLAALQDDKKEKDSHIATLKVQLCVGVIMQ
jgi:septal ring factor EnvC (AmiA/AmiB activator)